MHRRLEGQSNVPLTLYNIKIVGGSGADEVYHLSQQ